MLALCRLAEADWVITTPGKYVKDLDLYQAITWRRVIADEAHQLTANLPGNKGVKMSKAEKDAALLKRLGEIPVSVSRWCLSGTPLKNFRQVLSLDRIFGFLNTGFSTVQLSSNQFVEVMNQVAIRFTKAGTFQVLLPAHERMPWAFVHPQAL